MNFYCFDSTLSVDKWSLLKRYFYCIIWHHINDLFTLLYYNPQVYCALWMKTLLTHNFVKSCIGYLKTLVRWGRMHIIHTVKHFRIQLKKHTCLSPSISLQQTLSTGKLFSSIWWIEVSQILIFAWKLEFLSLAINIFNCFPWKVIHFPKWKCCSVKKSS